MKALYTLSGTACFLLILAGCADTPEHVASDPVTTVNDATTTLNGTFEHWQGQPVVPTFVTYRTDLVPAGSKATMVTRYVGVETTVTVQLAGLKPDRLYTAHVHAKPCGPDPNDSGVHYQHLKDHARPSVDPAFANPANELWLSSVSDTNGTAIASSKVAWTFRKDEAASVVLHAEQTRTAQGSAGTAGARIACVTARFGR